MREHTAMYQSIDFFSVFRREVEDNGKSNRDAHGAIREETGGEEQMLERIYCRNGLFAGSVQGDKDCTENTLNASNPPENI